MIGRLGDRASATSGGRAGRRGAKVGLIPQAVVVILVLGLVGTLVIKPTRQLLAQRDRIQATANDLSQVRSSNAQLRQRIARLNDPDYIEQRAREGMGLIKPGETSYVVLPPARPAPGRHGRENSGHRPRRDRGASGDEPGGFLQFLGLH